MSQEELISLLVFHIVSFLNLLLLLLPPSTRVSNELGAGHPQAASLAVKVVVFLAITEGLIVGLTMILARGIWGYAYSNVEEVVRYVAIMMPILATSNLLDGMQCVLSGTVSPSIPVHVGIGYAPTELHTLVFLGTCRCCQRMRVAKDWCFS